MDIQELSGSYLGTTYLLSNVAQLSSVLYMHSIRLILCGGLPSLHCGKGGTARKRLDNRGLRDLLCSRAFPTDLIFGCSNISNKSWQNV